MADRAGAMRTIAPRTPPLACPRQCRWRPTPRIRAAGAGGVRGQNSSPGRLVRSS